MAGQAWGSSSRLHSPPHMAGRSTWLIARDSFLLDMASRASRCKRGDKVLVLCLEQVRTSANRSFRSCKITWTGWHFCLHDLCPTHVAGPAFFWDRKNSLSLVPSSKHSHLEQARTDLCPACVIVFSFRTKMDRRQPARSHLRLPYSVKVGCVVVLSPRGNLALSRKRDHICAFACSVKVDCVVVLVPWNSCVRLEKERTFQTSAIRPVPCLLSQSGQCDCLVQ